MFLVSLSMGFGDAVGPFVSLAKDEFQLGLLSIPVGVFQDQRGKKVVVPLGADAAILQVDRNPLMRDVPEEGKHARNLSLGQFVNAIGSRSDPVIPVLAARYFGARRSERRRRLERAWRCRKTGKCR